MVDVARPVQPVHRAGAALAGRRLIGAVLWLGLAAAVLPWWLNTPAGSISGTSDVLIAAGRVTGLVGGYVLLLQLLLMSRLGWLERRFGAAEMLAWHREMGHYLVLAVVAHIVFITLGYAWLDRVSVPREFWTVLTTFEDLVSATVAAGLLIGIGVLGLRRIRQALPYELWYYTHLTAYLVLLWAYGHQFATGMDMLGGLGRAVWIGLYAAVLAALAWGRVVVPARLNLRHRLRVASVEAEGPDMFSVYIHGRRLTEMEARAGQYFRWRFLTPRGWWQAHPFSLSAAPNGQWLRLTIKAVGSHTSSLRQLRPGVRVLAEGPSGVFTAARRTRPKALLIAGGSGIAPIRALLEELPRGAIVIYRAGSRDELIFERELEWIGHERDTMIYYVLGSRDDPWPRKVFSPRGLRELVPDVATRDVYLCGPSGLVRSARRVLRRVGVRRRQIHVDPFEF